MPRNYEEEMIHSGQVDDVRTEIILSATRQDLVIIRLRAALRALGLSVKEIDEITNDA